MYKCFFKRILDFIISLIALLCIGWALVIVWIWLTIANRPKEGHEHLDVKNQKMRVSNIWSRAFFFQERPGKDEKIFKVIKFKTMTDEKDADGNLLPDAERLTKVGKFVRSTSIDELPQLINVLKGDMSFIGPRPLLVKYLPLYSEKQHRRHEVRPGMSGWAQVNGRNNISWTKKFEYDVYYVEHISFVLDIKIFVLTIKKVFMREGINEQGNATMEAFNGNN